MEQRIELKVIGAVALQSAHLIVEHAVPAGEGDRERHTGGLERLQLARVQPPERLVLRAELDGDGVADINISNLIKLHNKKKKIATVTAVNPIPRFGSLRLKNDLVTGFSEKVIDENNLINGGFFILEKKIFNLIDLSKNVMWEQDPMIELTKKKQLSAYYHKGFWHCMDTERDYKYLNKLYKKKAPWKIW